MWKSSHYHDSSKNRVEANSCCHCHEEKFFRKEYITNKAYAYPGQKGKHDPKLVEYLHFGIIGFDEFVLQCRIQKP
jgi:hypothetical protein